MLIDTRQARLRLDKGDHLKLSGARRARLTTVSGIAWITVDRDAGDTLVPAGDSFVVPSDRAVLVGPLFSSVTLDVQGTPEAMPCGERSRSTVGERLRTLRVSVLRRLPWRFSAARDGHLIRKRNDKVCPPRQLAA